MSGNRSNTILSFTPTNTMPHSGIIPRCNSANATPRGSRCRSCRVQRWKAVCRYAKLSGRRTISLREWREERIQFRRQGSGFWRIQQSASGLVCDSAHMLYVVAAYFLIEKKYGRIDFMRQIKSPFSLNIILIGVDFCNHQSRITCGTKSASSVVMRCRPSRIPNPAG